MCDVKNTAFDAYDLLFGGWCIGKKFIGAVMCFGEGGGESWNASWRFDIDNFVRNAAKYGYINYKWAVRQVRYKYAGLRTKNIIQFSSLKEMNVKCFLRSLIFVNSTKFFI